MGYDKTIGSMPVLKLEIQVVLDKLAKHSATKGLLVDKDLSLKDAHVVMRQKEQLQIDAGNWKIFEAELRGRFGANLDQLQKAAVLAQPVADPLEKAKQLNNAGADSYSGGDLDAAHDKLLEALALFQKAKGRDTAKYTYEDNMLLADIHFNLGATFADASQFRFSVGQSFGVEIAGGDSGQLQARLGPQIYTWIQMSDKTGEHSTASLATYRRAVALNKGVDEKGDIARVESAIQAMKRVGIIAK